MSTNNSSILYYTSRIKKYIDSKKFLSKKIDWYSNGARGHLHGSTRCVKHQRSPLGSVKHSLTLDKALEKRICDNCYQRGLDTLFERNTSEVISLLQIGDTVGKIKSPAQDTALPIEKVYELIQSLRQQSHNLNRIRDAAYESNFSKYYEKLQSEISASTSDYLASLDSKKNELLTDIMMRILMPENSYYNVDETNFTPHFQKMASGEDRHQARTVANIYSNWVTNLGKLNQAERLSSVLEQVKSLKLYNISQISELKFSNSPDSESSVLKAVEENWRRQIQIEATKIVSTWENKANDLMSKTSKKIVGIYLPSFRHEAYLNLLVDVFKATPVHKENHIVILRAPEIVGFYLLKLAELSSRGRTDFMPVSIVDDEETLDDLTLLTASSLWTPEESGVYKNFAIAIKASATI